MISRHGRWWRALAGACAAVILTALPACSGDGGDKTAPVAPVDERDLAGYDAFVIASAENNPLFADVYGLRFDPLIAERITTMKRISTMGADEDHVLVAAADGDVDRLAVVNGDGSLTRVPGLGRPYAFLNAVKDGVLYYETVKGDTEINREFAYDLATRDKELMFESAERSGVYPLIGGGFLYGMESDGSGADTVVEISDKEGNVRRLSYKAEVFGGDAGKRWLASTINAPDAGFGDKPETLVLLNIKSGKTKRVDGLQAICFTPDGTRLLARRVGDPLSSPLVLLDPDSPADLVEVGTIPALTIYSGSWVRGAAPA